MLLHTGPGVLPVCVMALLKAFVAFVTATFVTGCILVDQYHVLAETQVFPKRALLAL